MAITLTASTIIAAGTSNGAGSTTRGVLDFRTYHSGTLTIKLTNGASPPTIQAVANVLIAHNTSSTPTAGSAGTDWKTVASFGGGTTANGVSEWSITLGPEIMHVEVEITGNTGQAVACEAFMSSCVLS